MQRAASRPGRGARSGWSLRSRAYVLVSRPSGKERRTPLRRGSAHHRADDPADVCVRKAKSPDALAVLRCSLRSPRGELLAAVRSVDHAPYQSAPAQRERREHELAAVAAHIGRRRRPVLRLFLRKAPDPHGSPPRDDRTPGRTLLAQFAAPRVGLEPTTLRLTGHGRGWAEVCMALLSHVRARPMPSDQPMRVPKSGTTSALRALT
jgi:hypothetical protein